MRSFGIAMTALCIAALAPPTPSDAHGIEGHEHRGAKKKQAAMPDWLSLFSKAEAAAHVRVDAQGGYRYIKADGIPDHATGQFPNRGNPNTIRTQTYELRVTLTPARQSQPSELRHRAFGVALNGVVFDPETAEYWRGDRRAGWNIEAMGGGMDLGLDSNNAHVQPNGAYHYHALPVALMEKLAQQGRPTLLGYAADGFPIYGPFGHDGIKELRASWRVKAGERPGGPGGRHDGIYVQDYEYAPGSGDLDECNAREGKTADYPAGTTYYVITASFPFVPRCFWGQTDASFDSLKGGPPGRGGPGGGGPGMGPPGMGPPGGRPPPGMGPPSDDRRPFPPMR